MYRKRNKIYDRIQADRSSGLAERRSMEFVTVTVRDGAMTLEQAFLWIKRAVAYAIQKVRKTRVYNKSYRRSAWGGCDLEYINDVDIQPGTAMPHIHGLYSIGLHALRGKTEKEGLKRRLMKRFAKEVHYYVNNYLRKRLGLPVLRWKEGEEYPYSGVESLAYVHVSEARSSENCAMYMALHNGKIWTDGRRYPVRFRRFSTSRGYFPKSEEKAPSDYIFVKQSLSGTLSKLRRDGVPVEVTDRAGETILGVSVAVDDRWHIWDRSAFGETVGYSDVHTGGSYRLRAALGLAAPDPEPFTVQVYDAPADALEKMLLIQQYWDSGADLEGVSFDAWCSGASLPSLGDPGADSNQASRLEESSGEFVDPFTGEAVDADAVALMNDFPGAFTYEDALHFINFRRGCQKVAGASLGVL